MSNEEPKFRKWRAEVQTWQETGEALERIASQYPDLPLEVSVWCKELQWIVWGETIQQFAARVKQVAQQFGRPDSVYTGCDNGAERSPDFLATWRLPGSTFVLRITSYAPQCRVKPGSQYRPKIAPEVHPECAAVLEELADLEPETVGAV